MSLSRKQHKSSVWRGTHAFALVSAACALWLTWRIALATSPEHPLAIFESEYAKNPSAAEKVLSGWVAGVQRSGFTKADGSYDIRNAVAALQELRNGAGRVARTVVNSRDGTAAKAADQLSAISTVAAGIAKTLQYEAKPRDRDEAEACGRGQKAFAEIISLQAGLLAEAGKVTDSSALVRQYSWIAGLVTTQPDRPGTDLPPLQSGRFEGINWDRWGRHLTGRDVAAVQTVKTFLDAVAANDERAVSAAIVERPPYCDAKDAMTEITRWLPKDGPRAVYQIGPDTHITIVDKDGLTKILVQDIAAVWAEGRARVYVMCDVVSTDQGLRLGFAPRNKVPETSR